MKRVSICLLALFLASNLLAQPQRIISSKIVFVDVFRNQAQIKRTASLPLEVGSYTLIFDKLSTKLIHNSMELIAPEGVEVLSISNKKQYYNNEDLPTEISVLNDSLQQLREQLNGLRMEREALQVQKDLLLANKNLGGSSAGVKADELEDVLGVFQRKFIEFRNEHVRIEKQEKSLRHISNGLEKIINDYKSGKQAMSQQIWVQVKVNKNLTQADFIIQYLVSSVSWQPMYDIRVKDIQSPLQIILKAGIAQNTGENWDQVNMRLSSSDPQIGNTKPELTTQFLNYREPMIYKSERKARNTYQAEPSDMLVSADGEINDLAVVEQNMLNVVFDIQGLVYVPSENKMQQVELTQFKLPAVYGFAAVPKLSEDVFVTAKVQNNDIISQLSGEAGIYLNGVFTGKIQLNQQIKDSLLLTLGKDRRLSVSRAMVKSLNSNSFFGSNKKELQTYEITITNNSKEHILLLVEDQIPVSKHADLEVKLISQDQAIHQLESGKLSWNVSLEPKQLKKVRFSYELIYPKEKFINNH